MSFQEFVADGTLEPMLVELVRTHVSQLNGCVHTICRYTQRARALGETEERIYLLADWLTPLYNRREPAAFEWAEAVIKVGVDVSDGQFKSVRDWFADEETFDLRWWPCSPMRGTALPSVFAKRPASFEPGKAINERAMCRGIPSSRKASVFATLVLAPISLVVEAGTSEGSVEVPTRYPAVSVGGIAGVLIPRIHQRPHCQETGLD